MSFNTKTASSKTVVVNHKNIILVWIVSSLIILKDPPKTESRNLKTKDGERECEVQEGV